MNENIPEKMSRTILYLKTMSIRLHVKLYNEKFNYHSETTFAGKKYLRIEPSVFATIELPKDNTIGFSSDRCIMITQANIYTIITNFEKLYKSICDEKIFYMQNNEIRAYSDMVKKFTIHSKMPGITNQAMLMMPAVIHDENDVTYEGVRICLNKMSNSIDLAIEEFEAVIYALKQMDLFTYSQLLINYFTLYYNKDDVKDNIKDTAKQTQKRFIWDNTSSEEVTASFAKKTDNGIFDGLKEDDNI